MSSDDLIFRKDGMLTQWNFRLNSFWT